MARIRKHREKWQVLFRDPATKRERSAGVFSRKSDATRQRRVLEHQLEVGDWIDPALRRTPFGLWAARWLKTRSHLKPKTVAGYESLLRSRILPTFGDARLQDIRAIHVEGWIAEMVEEDLSPSRIRQAYNVTNAILKSAVRSQMLTRNAAEGISLPPISNREMLFLEPSEVDLLAAAIPKRYETLIYTLAYCGLRAGEAVALRTGRVNVVRSELVIAESATEVLGKLVFGETKSRKRRTVAMPVFLRDRMNRHLMSHAGRGKDALVFTTASGSSLRLSNFRYRIWKPAVVAAGLNPALRVHDLRHTAVTMLISQGAHPKAIQEHLGHSSIAVTMDRYGHLYSSEREKMAIALESVYRAANGAASMESVAEADQMQTGRVADHRFLQRPREESNLRHPV